MAQSVIGALRVNLGLDSAQFTRGTNQAQRRLRDMRAQFLVVAGAAAALGSAITAMALRGAADIDRMAKAARRLDGSIGAFQALELAAGEAGVSLSALTNDLQTMNRELASNSAGAQRSLRRLRLSADELLSFDSDERVAVIADRIREMGLSAAEATVILRDLGVRNREMALMMIQGGAAIRSARDDVRDYGLEIDDALGARVERARDQMGRLTIVTQYFGQRLAAEIVPALGRFAQAITDSMREGGALRRSLDLLIDNLQRLVTIVGTAVAFFGIRYVAALALARVATFSLVGALAALKTAIVRTGFGALIVGAGFLIDLFIRLRTATGSWAEVLTLLGKVAAGVWEGIKTGASSIPPALRSYWFQIRADFQRMVAGLADMWRGFIEFMAPGLAVVGSILPGGLGESARRLSGIAESARNFRAGAAARVELFTDRAEAEAAEARSRASTGFNQARDALSKLNEALSRNTDLTGEASEEARRLAAELAGLAGGEGGGGARGAAAAVDALADSVDALGDATQQVESSFESAFVNFVTSTQSAREAISNLLRDLARLAAQSAFRQLFGAGGPAGGIFSMFAPAVVPRFSGGGFTGHGARTGGLDGEGGFGAILHPNETVIDHSKGGGGQRLHVTVGFDQTAGGLTAYVRDQAGKVLTQARPHIVRDSVQATYASAQKVPIR